MDPYKYLSNDYVDAQIIYVSGSKNVLQRALRSLVASIRCCLAIAMGRHRRG